MNYAFPFSSRIAGLLDPQSIALTGDAIVTLLDNCQTIVKNRAKITYRLFSSR
jgi:hypothetical protein